MSRRTHNDEIELGSDSFLDIIANIVGILIILIVIAGVKVSRQPLVTEAEPAVVTTASVEDIAEESKEEPIVAKAFLEPDEEEETETIEERVFPIPAAPAIFVEVTQDEDMPIAVATRDFEFEESQLGVFAERKQQLNQNLTHLASQRSVASAELDRKRKDVTKAQQRLALLQFDVDKKREEARKLRRQLAMAEQQTANVEDIEHKVTPLGRDVTGKELHFRIEGGKVSMLPIDALIKELKSDASRHQRVLMHTSSYQGTVGPNRGYRMKYEIRRKLDSFSVGVARVVVSQWTLEPTRELEEETVEQASVPGSLFIRQLMMSADHKTTVTFWVYPDSFAAYRELQKLVHAEGLRVAGRPLPFGVPIAGSPNGSKSSGQ